MRKLIVTLLTIFAVNSANAQFSDAYLAHRFYSVQKYAYRNQASYVLDTASIFVVPVNHWIAGMSANYSKYGITAEISGGYQWGRMQVLLNAGLSQRPNLGNGEGITSSPNFGLEFRYLPWGIKDTSWQPYVGVEAGGQFYRYVANIPVEGGYFNVPSQGYKPYIELKGGCMYDFGQSRNISAEIFASAGWNGFKTSADKVILTGPDHAKTGFYATIGVGVYFNSPNRRVRDYHVGVLKALTQKELKATYDAYK